VTKGQVTGATQEATKKFEGQRGATTKKRRSKYKDDKMWWIGIVVECMELMKKRSDWYGWRN